MAFSFAAGVVFAALLASVAGVFPRFYNTSQAIRDLSTGMILVMAIAKPFQSYHMSVYYTIRSGGQVLLTIVYDCGFLCLLVVPVTFLMCHYAPLPFLAIYAVCLSSELVKSVFGAFLLRKARGIKNLTLA